MPTFFDLMTDESKKRWLSLARQIQGFPNFSLKSEPLVKVEPKLENLKEIEKLMTMVDSQIKERYGGS